MKAAEAIVHTATGDHLSRAEKEKGGPIVHYAFGALTGGLYGGLAEYSSKVTSGFGTSFGGALFSTADLLAVPRIQPRPFTGRSTGVGPGIAIRGSHCLWSDDRARAPHTAQPALGVECRVIPFKPKTA